MDRILDAGFKQPAGESVLIQSRSLRASDPAFRAAIADVVARRLDAGRTSSNVRSPLASGERRPDLEGRALGARRVRDPRRQDQGGRQDRAGARPRRRRAAGPPAASSSASSATRARSRRSRRRTATTWARRAALSLPITLVILVIAFGALVAAGIPLLLALTAVFATFGLIALPSHLLPIATEAPAMVLLIGLAVGVDYSMFYLKRERQERAAGRSEQAALEAAAATSGRSVLISGLTVMVAMAGMFLTGDATFASLGVATILVVAVAVLGSLTVLPALLSRLGDKVDRLRVPFVGRLRRDDGEGRIWGAIVDRVLRRPALSALARRRAAAGARGARAPAAHRARRGRTRSRSRSRSSRPTTGCSRRSPARRSRRTSSCKAPNVNAPAVREAIGRLEQRALASGRDVRADHRRRSTATPPSRTSPSRSTAREPTPPRTLARGAARRRSSRQTRRRRPGHGGRRHRADGAVEGPGRRAEVEACRSSSPSCSCSRSR